MADKNIDLLTTCFWDLRSQCESQVRTLSDAQRLLDEYRRADGRPAHEALMGNLRENVNDLTTANAAIQEVLAEVRRQIDVRPAGNRRKRKHLMSAVASTVFRPRLMSAWPRRQCCLDGEN